MTSFGGDPSGVSNEFDRVRERDLDVLTRNLVSPTEYTVRFLTLGQRRQLKPLHELVDVAPVIRVDHRTDLRQHVLGVGAMHVDRLLRHHRVDTIRIPFTCSSIQSSSISELLGTEAHRAEHTQTTRLAHRGNDITTVRESEDRILNPEHLTQRRSHRTLRKLDNETRSTRPYVRTHPRATAARRTNSRRERARPTRSVQRPPGPVNVPSSPGHDAP